MTAPTTTDRATGDDDLDLAAFVEQLEADAGPSTPAPAVVGETGDAEPQPSPLDGITRPLIACALTAGAAGLMTGGIFGSWPARLLGAGAALFGVGWARLAIGSRRRTLIQCLVLPVAFILGVLALVPTRSGPARLAPLVRAAISSGRLLRPPVPFDAGWRPILIVLLATLGFAAAWVGIALRKPQLGLALPLPILGLTAISQPAEGQFIAGVLALVPVLIALGVLFGGEGRSASDLSSQFELKRALRSAPLAMGAVVLLVLLNQSSFLFPRPAYNPAQKPQKPKPVSLGQTRDRVLFEIDGPITGPWKTGVLDIYDGSAWRLPPFDPKRLKPVPGDGVVDKTLRSDVTVHFTTRDLGTSSVLPGVSSPTKVTVSGAKVVFDPRAGVVRQPVGRVAPDLSYQMSLPTYPTAAQLRTAPAVGKFDRDFLFVPKAPPGVAQLLAAAPTTSPWDRLDYLRQKLRSVVIAAGAGLPNKPVPPSKVDDLLVGSHEGSPFEIVAAEALLARWAGVPSRIGFGFDGGQTEKAANGTDVTTVRPKNGANWLEAYFPGFGWIPLIGTPPKAKAALSTDKNTKFDASVAPSDDIAVEMYVPVEVKNLTQLYQLVRFYAVRGLALALAALLVWLGTPAMRRALRARRRRRWASGLGPRAQIAVEYTEFRDLATDLNVGDGLETALEFIHRIDDDDEHRQLAWLVTRVLYGDLDSSATATDVQAATEMSRSLRRRLVRAQPLQSRILAIISRASLKQPYSMEMPGARPPKAAPAAAPAWRSTKRRTRWMPARAGSGR
jgi:transglutaminase-like putative cysteine protease